jgi:cytoskeletal protein RodZ
MRSRHEPWLVAVAVCGVLGTTRLLSAQEAPPAPAQSAPPAAAPAEAARPAGGPTASTTETTTTAEATSEAEVEGESDAADEKAAAKPPKAVGATPGRFEPTEKVRADFDVSFPIDI